MEQATGLGRFGAVWVDGSTEPLTIVPQKSKTRQASAGILYYREFLQEREQLLKHKWLLSEQQDRDVGFEAALADWVQNHREAWRRERNRMLDLTGSKVGR